MKLLQTTLLAVSLLASPAYADVCNTVHSVSTAIMKNRQVGTSLKKMMDVANDPTNEKVAKLLTKIIVAAYEQPRFSVVENQEKAITDFANKLMLECVKAK